MIYIITHKVFEPYFVDVDHYKILHVGTNDDRLPEYLSDDIGDNISKKNTNFCELTALYWIWKNGEEHGSDITGLVHYRRYFTNRFGDFFYTYFNKKPKVLDYSQIEKCLRRYDIVLPIPEKIMRTVRQSYADVHNDEDLVLTRKVISEVSAEYLNSFDKVMYSHKYYYANMMICSKQVFDEYSEWLFKILFNLEKKINIDKYADNYQKRVFGFLSERLLQVWVYHNKLKVKEFPVFNTEAKRITFWGKNKSRLLKLCHIFKRD